MQFFFFSIQPKHFLIASISTLSITRRFTTSFTGTRTLEPIDFSEPRNQIHHFTIVMLRHFISSTFGSLAADKVVKKKLFLLLKSDSHLFCLNLRKMMKNPPILDHITDLLFLIASTKLISASTALPPRSTFSSFIPKQIALLQFSTSDSKRLLRAIICVSHLIIGD